MPSSLQGILELLVGRRFHELSELQEETELSEKQTRGIVAFFVEYGFAEMDKRNEKVRTSKDARELLAQTTT